MQTACGTRERPRVLEGDVDYSAFIDYASTEIEHFKKDVLKQYTIPMAGKKAKPWIFCGEKISRRT